MRKDSCALIALLAFLGSVPCFASSSPSEYEKELAEALKRDEVAQREIEDMIDWSEKNSLLDAIKLDALRQARENVEAWRDTLDVDKIAEFTIDDGSLLDAVRQVSRQGWNGNIYLDAVDGPTHEEAEAIQVRGFSGAFTVREAINRVLSGTEFVATAYRASIGLRIYRPQGMPKTGEERPVLVNFGGGRLGEEAEYLYNRTGTKFDTGKCTSAQTSPGVKGELKPLEAWAQLIRGVCMPPTYTLPEFQQNSLLLWYAGLQSAAGKREVKFAIDEKERKFVIRDLAKQANLDIPYLSQTDEEEEKKVGPINGVMSIHRAIYKAVVGSLVYPRWIDGSTVSIEPLPFYDAGRVCRDKTVCNLVWEPPETGEIQVTAARVPTVAERASVADADDASVIVIDRKRIDELGVSSLPEVLQHLPQSAYTRAPAYLLSGAQYAEGRGVGPAMVYIEGQRTMASVSSLQDSALDLNTIPLAAVERIEFIPNGGSTVYGVDAIGGILNIVLRRPTQDLLAEARYGSARGGAIERRVTALARAQCPSGDAVVIADQLDLTQLPGVTRSRYANQDYSRYVGGIDRRSLASELGNFQSTDRQNIPGFNTTVVGLPEADGRQAFEIGDLSEQPNLTSLLRYQSVSPARERASLVTIGNLHFDAIDLSANAIYTHQRAEYTMLPPSVRGVVASDHPQNPLDQPLIYSGLLTGIPSQQYQSSDEMFRAAVALKAYALGWNIEFSLAHTREQYSTVTTNVLDPIAVAESLSSNDPATALRFFSETPGAGRSDLLTTPLPEKYLANASYARILGETSFRFLPVGKTHVQIGADWRNEEMSSPFVEGTPARDATGAFVKLDIPVLKGTTFSAGTRADRYSDGGSVISGQLGFEWIPSRLLKVHADFGERYRPPSLFELHMDVPPFDLPLTDPKTGRTAMATVVGGGRRDLLPTTARSSGMGFSLTTDEDLAFSVYYWRVQVKDRISTLPLVATLQYEDYLPGRVIREPPSIDGRPGQIRSVDISWANLGEVEAAGVDFTARKEFPAWSGRFISELGVTWNSRYRYRELPEEIAPLSDRVGVLSQRGTILRHRATAQFAWQNDAWRFAGNITEHPSYSDRAPDQSPFTVRSQALVDLNVSRRWGKAAVTIGAINAFDSEAGYANSPLGYDSSQGDLRKRFLYGEVRFGF